MHNIVKLENNIVEFGSVQVIEMVNDIQISHGVHEIKLQQQISLKEQVVGLASINATVTQLPRGV